MNPERFPEYKHAVEEFLKLGLKPGDIVPRDWVDTHLGIDPKKIVDEATAQKIQLQRLSRTAQFKEALLEEHRIYIESVPGKGFEVVAPGNQTARAQKSFLAELRSTAVRFQRALNFIDTAKLTDAEMKENTDARVKIAALRGESRKLFRFSPSTESPMKSSTPRGALTETE